MLRFTKPAALVVATVFASAGLARADDTASGLAKLVADKSPALVTVKFVLKIKAGSHEQENETEITGIVMDPKGLILCSSQQIGGISPAMQRMASARGL